MKIKHVIAGTVLAAIAAGGASAQSYPNRPVRVVIPYAPGGVVDTTARLVQAAMQDALGQPVVIDNKSGAAGEIGSAIVAKAAPDGYTLLIDNESHSVNPAITPKLPYDTERDFTPITQISVITRIFVVNVQTPAKTIQEFVKLAKANPGKFNYANAASPVQLAMELFNSMAGTKIAMVAYRGGAPAMQAMVSNETQITLVPLVPALSYIKNGQLRALATAGKQRSPQIPDVPTIAEAGYPNFEAPSWVGVFGPAGTPQPIVDRVRQAVLAALKAPDVQKRFSELGMEPAGTTPEAFRQSIAREIANWTKVAHDNHIVAQ